MHGELCIIASMDTDTDLPIANTGMKTPDGTGRVIATAAIKNCNKKKEL